MTVFYCFFRPVVIEYCHTAEDSRLAVREIHYNGGTS